MDILTLAHTKHAPPLRLPLWFHSLRAGKYPVARRHRLHPAWHPWVRHPQPLRLYHLISCTIISPTTPLTPVCTTTTTISSSHTIINSQPSMDHISSTTDSNLTMVTPSPIPIPIPTNTIRVPIRISTISARTLWQVACDGWLCRGPGREYDVAAKEMVGNETPAEMVVILDGLLTFTVMDRRSHESTQARESLRACALSLYHRD